MSALPTYARPDFEAPLARVAARVDAAIDGLHVYSKAPAWRAALDATLAIHRAPKHLLRAQLVLLGSVAGGGAPAGDALERFAAGVELLHLFMLVHDDVMDNATVRRGQPALRIALQAADPAIGWQAARDMAVVAGSAIAMLAVRHITPGAAGGEGVAGACELMLEACFHAGAGQIQDLAGLRGLGEDDAGDTERALRRELCDKTAFPSFAAPFAAGLLLACPGADTAGALRWGEHVGVAFQALDDLTDLVAPAAQTGKDALRDLLGGRPSLPLLLLRERAGDEDRAFLDALVGQTVLDLGDRAHLDALIVRAEVLAACSARIRAEIEAAAALSSAPIYPPGAQAGMRVFEESLLAYLGEVIAAASESEGPRSDVIASR